MPEDPNVRAVDFDVIAAHLHQLIEQSQGDPIALLKILRFLENLHHEVREQHFQTALPIHRHELYAMLREMEAEGGWPYIPKMQLRNLLGTEVPLTEVVEEEASEF